MKIKKKYRKIKKPQIFIILTKAGLKKSNVDSLHLELPFLLFILWYGKLLLSQQMLNNSNMLIPLNSSF